MTMLVFRFTKMLNFPKKVYEIFPISVAC